MKKPFFIPVAVLMLVTACVDSPGPAAGGVGSTMSCEQCERCKDRNCECCKGGACDMKHINGAGSDAAMDRQMQCPQCAKAKHKH